MPFPKEQERELDFSKPLPLSDVVLVVEEQRFNAHRGILAMWSPVFQKMFSSEFKEKTAEEVPLPEKEASQIKEMLLVIYPTSAKPVDEKNCYFLLTLAREYQMVKLTQKCEDVLLNKLQRSSGSEILDLLIVAQDYDLERLKDACIEKGETLSLETMVGHKLYEQIEYINYRKLVERKMKKLEEEVSSLRTITKMQQSGTVGTTSATASGLFGCPTGSFTTFSPGQTGIRIN